MQASARPSERQLILVVGVIVFVDTMFYAAIAPLLPGLADELNLSKRSAGVMTASYPLGTLLGSVPSGIMAARAGPKSTVSAGLALLGSSTLAFGLLDNVALLDLARLIEGLGGACLWAGGLAWIVVESPPERRGELIGGALGAAIAGALFGPVIGTVATAAGRGPTFGAVVMVAALLAAWVHRLPSGHVDSRQGVRQLGDAFRSPAVVLAMWLVILPAMASGVISVLVPLRLHRLGAGAAVIGAAFLIAAALEAAISPAIGRVSDRRGRLVPVRYGLVVVAAALPSLIVPGSPLGLSLLLVLTAAALGAFWAPAMAMLSDAAELRGLDQGLAAALTNLAWAGGQILGSGVGGAVAKALGDTVPLAIAAAMCLGTFLLLAPGQIRSAFRSKARA